MSLNLSLLLKHLSANYTTLRTLKDLEATSTSSVGAINSTAAPVGNSITGNTHEADASQMCTQRTFSNAGIPGSRFTRTSKYLVLPDDVVRLAICVSTSVTEADFIFCKL